MAKIIYSIQSIEKTSGILNDDLARSIFAEAALINHALLHAGKRIAYFFIDPLINPFEAANHFYFKILGISSLNKLNCYKSGSGPIQALADAQELIEHDLYDAVFICGYEPLLSNKIKYGKAAIQQHMDIFNGPSILHCYHKLAELYSQELEIEAESFTSMAEALWQNYQRTFTRTHPKQIPPLRGPNMQAERAPLFYLTDCANPNLDFTGGIIMANDETLSGLNISARALVEVKAVHYAAVEADPLDFKKIIGSFPHHFPHLQESLNAVQAAAGLDLVQEVKAKRMLLDLYSCYPPIPLAFLFTSGLAANASSLQKFLAEYEVTLDGGLNLAGAPWNNPVLSSLITIHQLLPSSSADYALIHGNGGIGEIQGIGILAKVK